MTEQVFNPLRFRCAPNQATPDYVIYDDFRSWIAYGLLTCWLGSDADDPNSECYMARPVTREDVQELRHYFLNLVETVVVTLWKGEYKPRDGCIDGDWQSLVIGNGDENPGEDETLLTWYVRLDDEAMMFELDCTGSDLIAIWLSYDAIADRRNVLKVLFEARRTLASTGDHSEVWPKLIELGEGEMALVYAPERNI